MKSMSLIILSIFIMCSSCHKEHSAPGYPTKGNAEVSTYASYPASGKWATLAFEDDWPNLGDYDMNDLVVSYRYSFAKNKAGDIVSLQADFAVTASGASFYNGLGFELPISTLLVQNVTGQRLNAGYIQLNANGTEAGQHNAVIIPFDNHEDLLHYSDHSYFINVYPAKYRTAGDTAHVVVTFTKPLDKSYIASAPFNPFLISNMRRGHEVHLPGGKPTDKADKALFNTNDDNSGSGTNYVSKNKFPWALNFTDGMYEYPIEKARINTAYLHYQDWIQSGRKNYGDWYSNSQAGYRNDDNIFH